MDQFFFWLAEYDANFAQSLFLFVNRFWPAVLTTLQVTFGSCAIAIVIGFPLALIEEMGPPVPARIAHLIVSIGQGIPLPPLVFLIYFTALSVAPTTPVQAALLAIGIFTTPYAAAIFKAGIRSVPRGQIEVAQALGMRYRTIVRRLVAPVAIRVVLPSLGHLAIVTLLNSSFASVIGAGDLTGMTRNIINANFSTPLWLVVGAVYFLIAFPVSRILLALERRMEGSSR